MIEGNLRKMRSALGETVQYTLELPDVLEYGNSIAINDLIGKEIEIQSLGYYNSILSGEKIKKTFGEGLTYKEFMESPMASPSIIRPELSRIHEGIALRDEAWEKEHHLTPHTVYLSLTSGMKVGVTRNTQVPTRWIDQGAIKALKIAETPYRGAAGLIEVALKDHIADKTNWQRMLKNQIEEGIGLSAKRDELFEELPEEFEDFWLTKEPEIEINYPVLQYPEKVKSIKLEKVPLFTGKLTGIRGQYLMFETGQVINIRSHSGHRVRIQY
jgi:hypothetical protein